jgi:hypothetical protein
MMNYINKEWGKMRIPNEHKPFSGCEVVKVVSTGGSGVKNPVHASDP